VGIRDTGEIELQFAKAIHCTGREIHKAVWVLGWHEARSNSTKHRVIILISVGLELGLMSKLATLHKTQIVASINLNSLRNVAMKG
jgi:hypothetical protein